MFLKTSDIVNSSVVSCGYDANEVNARRQCCGAEYRQNPLFRLAKFTDLTRIRYCYGVFVILMCKCAINEVFESFVIILLRCF